MNEKKELDIVSTMRKRAESIVMSEKHPKIVGETILEPSHVLSLFQKYCRHCGHENSLHFENDIRAIIQCEECGHNEEYGSYCERREF